jgi:3-oxoacyl-[acyl-carrier protein] reductase
MMSFASTGEGLRIDGANVVITGGAGRIGLATARRFVQAGARVVIADIDGDRARACAAEVDPSGASLHAVRCDVAEERDCADLVTQAEAFFGAPLDVFLANAGVGFSGSVLDAKPADIRRVVDVNVTGCILSAQAALASLLRGRDPSLLFTASLQSVTGRAQRSVYTATRHATAGLVRSLALELGPLGVRVNAIAPTAVDTPFLRATYERIGIDAEEGIARAASAVPLGRLPTPEDFAEAALFLVSPSARSISGHILMLDCGATAGSFNPSATTPRNTGTLSSS